MFGQELLRGIKIPSNKLFIFLLFFPKLLQASFIEATMGTAVVDDATATYHNPAALNLLHNSQFIALSSFIDYNDRFKGQVIDNTIESGQANTHINYILPSVYLSTPIQDRLQLGLAVVSNMLNTNIDTTSILRYATPNAQVKNLDFMPALGFQVNDYLSVGAGFNYSFARFTSTPIIGFRNLNIADTKSTNVASGADYGGNAGFVLKPTARTLIGFNYRSSVTYPLRGSSEFKGSPPVTSDEYSFNFWTPARSVLTLSHFPKPDLGFIATIQRVQWSIFEKVIYHGLATQIGTQTLILPNVTALYHFRDTWTFTVGGIKHITPKWVLRVAGTYDQSPGNGNYQIINGDTTVIGASMGYEIYKNVTIDGSYSYMFIKNKPINIISGNNLISGINKSAGDAVSIKITLNA